MELLFGLTEQLSTFLIRTVSLHTSLTVLLSRSSYCFTLLKATRFSLGTYNVCESAGFVRVTVMVREGQLGRNVFVTLQTANGSAVCKLDL